MLRSCRGRWTIGWRIILVAGTVVLGCAERLVEPEAPSASDPSGSLVGKSWSGPVPPASYSADVARGWFDLSYDLVKQERWSPPVASRQWGYASVALYETIRPGMAGYHSLQGQVNGLAGLPQAHGAYHGPAAANAALHTVFAGLYAGASQAARDRIEAFYRARADDLRGAVPPGMFDKSERFGSAVAHAVLAWSRNDGYVELDNCAYTPPEGAGLWVPTPPAFAPALQPCWGQLRTCAVSDGAVCDPQLPPAYSEVPASDFYAEAFEVYDTVNNLTSEQLAIANFWADNPGQTGTPPGHWIAIVGQVLVQEGSGLDVAAEVYAKVGLATMDAFICCWNTKYHVNLIRPISYINALIDASWTTPVVTPPFPEYTSGHSTQSGAVAEVLTDMFGGLSFTDRTHESIGMPARSFHDFWEAAEEAAISRLYGGIHYRSAIENGLDQGRCIGEQVSALRWGPEPL